MRNGARDGNGVECITARWHTPYEDGPFVKTCGVEHQVLIMGLIVSRTPIAKTAAVEPDCGINSDVCNLRQQIAKELDRC